MGARYSRNTGYTIAKRQAARSTVRGTSQRFKIGPSTARYIGLIVLAALGLLALTQSGRQATTAYKKEALRSQQAQLQSGNEALKVEVERARALQNATIGTVKDGLQPVTNVQFITEQGSVAGATTKK